MLQKVDTKNKVWLNFEFKDTDRKVVEAVLELLIKYNKVGKSIWGMSGATKK